MTTTDLQQDAFLGIRAVHEDRQYVIGLLGEHFTSLSAAWSACTELADDNPSIEGWVLELRQAIDRSSATGHARPEKELNELEDLSSDRIVVEVLRAQPERPNLEVFRLRIESPMEVTLAVVQGGGFLGISAYGIHLLRQVLHDPDRVGSWLPRLIGNWHRAMADAEGARYQRLKAKYERHLEEMTVPQYHRQLMNAARDLANW